MKTEISTCSDAEKLTCVNCDSLFDESETHNINGENYCDTCFSELFCVCEDCGTVIKNEDSYTTKDGNIICEGCYSENYFTCENCGEIEHSDSLVTVDNTEYWCERCAIRRAYRCERCGDYHSSNMTYVESESGYICESCLDNYFFYCDSCDEYFRDGNSCNCEDEDESDLLKSYSYKPSRPNFLKLKTDKKTVEFYGIELECEARDSRREAIEDTVNLLNSDEDYIYVKHDGSLDDKKGFEVVTHPATYQYHMNNICQKVAELRKHSTSFDNGNCGIHIHVSRVSIGENRESQNMTIGKLLFFFANNNKFIECLAQRNSERWSKIDEKRNIVYKIKYQQSSDRYTAINLQNEKTIEFRIFKGTLNKSSFTKNLQFTKSIIDFCKCVNFTKLTISEYLKFLEGQNYPELNDFITNKYINRNK